ncbi:MAG: ATP-dependent DNA ligase [Chloroflexi bacterium]|nr:ATP-dependent DNA ligase [Chloroflexota bacterium]
MKMKRVAEAFQALEATSRRHGMSGILGKLFRETPKEQIDKLIYLLHGRLGPPYAAPDFGVDERLILLALTNASGVPHDRVERLYKEKGDLGLTAEELAHGSGERLDFGAVFDALNRIANATGAGAHERKVAVLTDLIKRASGIEARYILRILQGKLRLGVGDATIMDALSEAAVGGRGIRERIERVYSICSDLGLVGRLLLTQEEKALDTIRPQVGKPILAALAERLPSPDAIVRKMGMVAAEPKYDGLRLQLHKDDAQIRFFTRRLEDVTGMFPELAKATEHQITTERAIIDGEAVVYNPETGEFLPFQVTVRRKRKYGIEVMGARYPLRYFAFDLLYFDDEDLTQKPLSLRRQRLEEILRWTAGDPIQITEQVVTDKTEELERFFEENVTRGLEGIVVKRLGGVYQAGQRNFNWVKLKRGYHAELRDTVDVVIVGYLTGKGKRARFGIGSLVGAIYDPEHDRFRTVTKIGSGLTEVEWAEMRRLLDENRSSGVPGRVDSSIVPDVWTEPRYVVEVRADEITRSPRHTCGKVGKEPGYALRFPRVISFRWDKGPEDATTEQEIIEMYEAQQLVAGEAPQRKPGGPKRAA